MSGAPKLYFDTNAFIYATEETSDRSVLLGQLLSRSGRAGCFLTTSELSLAELLVKPLRDGNDELSRRYDAMIQTSAWLNVRPVNRSIIVSAGSLRAGLSVKLPDAIHLATAIATGCTHFLTADKLLRGRGGRAALQIDDMPGIEPLSMCPLDTTTLTTLLDTLSQ